jgi:hypothetical protein
MDINKTALERAFELARSGDCAGLSEISRCLGHEGYSSLQIEGPVLKKQLARLIKEAKAATPTGAKAQ